MKNLLIFIILGLTITLNSCGQENRNTIPENKPNIENASTINNLNPSKENNKTIIDEESSIYKIGNNLNIKNLISKEDINTYKNTNYNDKQAIEKLISNLPLNNSITELSWELDTSVENAIKITVKFKQNNLSEEELSNLLKYNASILFSLIPDLSIVDFNGDLYSFIGSRDFFEELALE